MPRRDIITKAVIGKGKKEIKNTYKLNCPNPPSTVLGCWVINHQCKGIKEKDYIELVGSYDINLWYSHDEDSKTDVATKHVEYQERIKVPFEEKIDDDQEVEIVIRKLVEPTCDDVDINKSMVTVDIQKTLGVEVVAETSLTIMTEPKNDKWPEVEDKKTPLEEVIIEPEVIEAEIETLDIEEEFIKDTAEE